MKIMSMSMLLNGKVKGEEKLRERKRVRERKLNEREREKKKIYALLEVSSCDNQKQQQQQKQQRQQRQFNELSYGKDLGKSRRNSLRVSNAHSNQLRIDLMLDVDVVTAQNIFSSLSLIFTS